MTCKSEHDRANVWYQVECPHCGDVSMHNMLLEEFTCGECDRPFKPVKRCEPMDDFPRRSELYLALISDLSDALSDAGCPWSAEGILDLRRRVARALPWDDCPDWLRPYRSVND